MGLQLQKDDQTTHIFLPSKEVAVEVDGGEQVVQGSWRTRVEDGEEKNNTIRYDIQGEDQDPVPVSWSFNSDNQLQAVIPAEANHGEASDAFAFAGQIVLDDRNDLTYVLLDGEGNPTGMNVTIYGTLAFNADNSKLLVDLAGDGGTAEILGAHGFQSLEADRNNIADFRGSDLLRFRAFTHNTLESLGFSVPIEARIDFVGDWMIENGALTFTGKAKRSEDGHDVVLGLAGKFKAVSGGFAYFADEDGTQLALQINGQHQWNAGNATWDFGLGFGDTRIEANLSGQVVRDLGENRRLTLTGSASFLREEGEAAEGEEAEAQTTFEVELEVKYEMGEDGHLTFTAQVSGAGEDRSYDLGLEGRYVFRSGVLSFQIKYQDSEEDETFSVQLEFRGNRANLESALKLVLGEDQVNIELSFTLRVRLVDGTVVKDFPEFE